MLVTDLKYGKAVIDRICNNTDFTVDVETIASPEFTDSEDALVIGRAAIKIFSLCHRGEAYSFPTNLYGPGFPTIDDWCELMEPYVLNPKIVKVFHNGNYDLNVFISRTRLAIWRNIWDTMIGAWLANVAIEKGLKARAPLYGRILKSLYLSAAARKEGFKSVDMGKLEETAEYNEEDTILTDELYQMQRFGKIQRFDINRVLTKEKTSWGKYVVGCVKNPMPSGTLRIPGEHLGEFEKLFASYHELPILKAVIRAEQRGFKVNLKKLKEIRKVLSVDKEKILRKLYQAAGKKINLNSGPQVTQMLKDNDVPTPFKTKKGKVALNANSLSKMRASSSIIAELEQYRKLEKMQSVYIGDPMKPGSIGMQHYLDKNNRIHSTINSIGAITGRSSSSNPNLQNLPQRFDSHGLRDCFIAPEGKLMIVIDYAQLELRIMAIISKDPAMTKILCDPKGDIHQNTADRFQVDRSPTAKQLNFLLLYGGMEYMLADKLTFEGVPTEPEEAKVYKDTYDQVYYRVHQYREELLEEHQTNHYVKLLTGRKRWLNDVDWSDKRSVHKAETTLSNNVVQGAGQDMLKASIIRCDPQCLDVDRILPQRMAMRNRHKILLYDYSDRLKKIRRNFELAKLEWIMQVHDEVIFYVDESAAEECLNQISEVMTWQHMFPAITDYSVPLVVEGGVGHTWKEAKSKTPLFHCTKGFETFQN